jgi:predicted NUDIX family NTP pyrophosphohydrolase
MAKVSAGLILYRCREGVEILLVHPGGPYYAKKDAGSWSIPKGEYKNGEDPAEVALREFEEETGIRPRGRPCLLGRVKQKAGKVVTAYILEGDLDVETIRSNTFELEWPPRSGVRQHFPEVDRAGWFGLEEASRRILPSQGPLLDEVVRYLSGGVPGPAGLHPLPSPLPQARKQP